MPNATIPPALGVDATQVALEVHEAAWKKLGQVIAKKRFEGRSDKKEVRLRARASSNIFRYEQLLLEIQAAQSLVSAPTVEEIAQARKLIQTVQEIAVADAAVRVGFDIIKNALDTTRDLASAVSIT